MTGSQGVNGDLENFPGHRLSELELLQVGVDGAKATLHALLLSHKRERQRRRDKVPVIAEEGAG
jgi:hypothetical protein